MIIRKLRLQQGWSQEHLAQISGLSVRTVQRAERGQTIGLESAKSLAAVFDINVEQLLTQEQAMTNEASLTLEEQQALEHVRDIKAFYSHLIVFLAVSALLIFVNWRYTPQYFWVVWAVGGWGIGLLAHASSVFEFFNVFFSSDWEKRQVEKRLGRKL